MTVGLSRQGFPLATRFLTQHYQKGLQFCPMADDADGTQTLTLMAWVNLVTLAVRVRHLSSDPDIENECKLLP